MKEDSTLHTPHSTLEQRETLFKGRIFGGDASLWIVIAILAVASVLVVYSSTASLAYSKAAGDTAHFMRNQVQYLSIGFFLMFIIHRLNYQSYLRFARIVFIFAAVLMALTFVIGVSSNDAVRSLQVGGLTFQPADVLKIALIMNLSKELAKRQKEIKGLRLLPVMRFGLSPKEREKNRWTISNVTIPLLLPVVLSCGMIFVSNFSTAALLFLACLVLLYVGRVRVGELWRIVRTVVLTVVAAVAVMYALNLGRSHVWVGRLTSFAGVEMTGHGAVDERSEDQVLNAKMAIASGGATGLGPGQSVQRTNLALPFSDYAYAFIAEEYGIIGPVIVLLCYLWIFFRATVIVRTCQQKSPALLVLGLAILIVLQAMISMMVAVDLFPVTGLPLPLVSMGGSSVVFTSISLGIILGISRQMQEKTIDIEHPI